MIFLKKTIIFFIFSNISCLSELFTKKDIDLCELTYEQEMNKILNHNGFDYIKTKNILNLKNKQNSNLYYLEKKCESKNNNLNNNYYLLKEIDNKNEMITKNCLKNFDEDENISDFNQLTKNILKNDYLKDYNIYEQSLKMIKVNEQKNHFVIIELKNLKEFLENFQILETFYPKRIFDLHCIKKIPYKDVSFDEINYFEPFSFIIYINFHNTRLYIPKMIKNKLVNNPIYYNKLMDNILESIFKLKNKKIFVKRTTNFIISDTDMFFLNFTKIENDSLKYHEIFARFIYSLMSPIQHSEIKGLISLITNAFLYFQKIHNSSIILENIIKWCEFKSHFYNIMKFHLNLKSTKEFHLFISQFGKEVMETSYDFENEGNSFVLGGDFAINKIQRKISDDPDEESIILKLFGRNSVSFFLIYGVWRFSFFASIFLIVM